MTSAQAVNIHEHWILLDAGEGVQIRLRKHGISFNKLNHVCISHMHGDHVLGLPGLIGSMNLLGRTAPLHLHGPVELERWVMETLRLTSTHLQFELKFNVNAPESREIIIEHSTFSVYSFPTKHRIPTHGFLIQEAPHPRNVEPAAILAYGLSREEIKALKSGETIVRGEGVTLSPDMCCKLPQKTRSYAYAADSQPSPEVVEHVREVDILYHEATFKHELARRAKETGHSTALQAGEIANAARVGQLYLGHFSSRYRDLTPLLAEAQQVFPNTVLAEDDLLIQVK